MEDEVKSVPPPEEELKRRQRAFIPINIITCVIALVAGLTLLFTPFISLDAGNLVTAMTSEGNPDEDYTSMNENDVIMHMIATSGDLKLSFTPLDFASFASNENPVGTLVKSMLVDNGLFEDTFVAGVGAGIVVILGLGDGTDITKDQISDLDITELSSFMKTAETDESAAREEFKQSILKVAESFDLQPDEDFDTEADKAFDEFIQQGKKTPDSPFSVEYLVCSAVSKAIEGEGNENETPVTVNNYEELADYLSNNVIPADEIDPQMLSLGCWILFALVAFPAAMWLLLALLSGLHILMKNKTFLTWYVKLTGFFPCLLFGIAPLILKAVMGSFDNVAAALLGSLSSLTWISGACFLALAILSIGFIYPRRRKIRELRRQVKN